MRNGCPQGYQFASAPAPSCVASVPAADSSRLSSAWTPHNLPQYGAWSDNAYSPALRRLVVTNFTAGSAGSKIMTSDDGGVTWTLRTSSDDTVGWNAIVWSSTLNLFAALAHGGAAGTSPAMTSPDGITWTGSNSAAIDMFFWDGLDWSPPLGLFAATAANGQAVAFQTSPDGVTWTARGSSGNGIRRVLWVQELSLFVATSEDSMQTSPDGVTWTARAIPSTSPNFGRIAWSPLLGLLVVVSLGSTTPGLEVITSPDGVNWTAHASVDDNTSAWLGVAWSPRFALFAAVSSTGRVMTSFDGARWIDRGTPIAADPLRIFSDFRWLDDFGWFIAIGRNATTPGVQIAGVMTSPL